MTASFKTFVVTFLMLSIPGIAVSDIRVTFRDGAPKDTFAITNLSACASGPIDLQIDMTDSAGKLIFDVTSAGAGVEVFQPLEITGGAEFLGAIPSVEDGQKLLGFQITNLPANGAITFTIDVDDTIGAREITVNGSEMSGSALMVQTASLTSNAVFDTSAIAVVETPPCQS